MIKSFIETQFPISKLSKESYKERKANYSQTLTGLGKWWGRKPLILVRATLLGLLMAASNNPKKDREIFLKILTMDEEGLWLRKSKPIPLRIIYENLDKEEIKQWFKTDADPSQPKYRQGTTTTQKEELQRLVFKKLSYDEKLTYCDRPEQIEGPNEKAWNEINDHLGTNAKNLPELFQELGRKQFGHVPRVGDAFCGGGSIPFEAARLGCDAFGSDLNPVAVLLTWAGLNIIGGGPEIVEQVQKAQREVYDAVDRQITEWGIEHNERGWRADAYLYCTETKCPECGYMVPLAPSWVIGEKTKTIAKLKVDHHKKRFDILIESGVAAEKMERYKNAGTVQDSYLICPNPKCKKSTPISMIRGDRHSSNGKAYGLRLWENDDIIPRPEDVFQERLYCIRWVETVNCDESKEDIYRYYRAPDENDMLREQKVLKLLKERFAGWQEKGYIPSRKIEPGEKTDEPIRTRGWTHWHHLFNPRQLIINGLISEFSENIAKLKEEKVGILLSLGFCCDWNAKLSRFHSAATNEGIMEEVFYNQALNTLYNYGVRPSLKIESLMMKSIIGINLNFDKKAIPIDTRLLSKKCDIWITDPPYADAINYHELSEFFLAWYDKHLMKLFPEWYTDSKRALAIQGKDENFRQSMVDSYLNLANNMPDNGLQVVMFTHQDASVWADLALILWAAGLRVTTAWTIATETDSALKKGNYVQGTVLLVLSKQTSDETTFLDEIYPEVELEVKSQLDSMRELEDEEDPNFGDSDQQLAAYAAALRVLTKYKKIQDIDIEKELKRSKKETGKSQIEILIENAVKIACDYLIPKGFDVNIWKTLSAIERFYIKGLEVESHSEYRTGVYQELARGFGVREYALLLASDKANQTRLKTPSEFGTRLLRESGFGGTLVRQVLFAIREVIRAEDAQAGKSWFRNELPDYWNSKSQIEELLDYFSTMAIKLLNWKNDSEAARILLGAVKNDHI